MGKRTKISEKLRQSLLYDSAFACVVCQKRPVQIHHIDGNNSNNCEDNLVVVCHHCHDDAHAKKALSQNLTKDRLQNYKKNWNGAVQVKRNRIQNSSEQRSAAGDFFSLGVSWAYINHRRVSQFIDHKIIDKVGNIFNTCRQRNLVDEHGFLLKPPDYVPSGHFMNSTVYDWFPYGADHALHALYSAFVDQLAIAKNPIHIDETSWTKTFIKHCVNEGDFVFFKKAQYFRRVRQDTDNAHIRVRACAKKIEFEYYVDTINMFGTTSISVSFSGHKSCSSFLQIKSIEKNNPILKLYCTPVALGVGFNASI